MRFDDIKLPNVRQIFSADPGHIFVDVDLSGADAQVVAAEAEDRDLLEAFKAGIHVHTKNAEDMWGSKFTQAPGTKKTGLKSILLSQCKRAVHATNYGAQPKSLAVHNGWTVHESDIFQRRWFSLHPGIKRWQERVMKTLKAPDVRERMIWNKWGNRKLFTDRVEENYKKALAWIPQSTIAQLTFKGARKVQEEFPEILSVNPRRKNGFILQVHDSLVFQALARHSNYITLIHESLRIPIPYEKPLIIDWSLMQSSKSWGEAK